MKRINISKHDDYYSQINNKRYPHSACNVTALTECLDITDQLFAHPEGMQPEDHLMEYLRSDKAYERMDEYYPWARKGGYEPNEVHAMLRWAVNEMVGKKVDYFDTKWSLQELVYELVVNENPSAVTGRFTDYGHIVVLVGIETEQMDIEKVTLSKDIEVNKIKNFIVDDPYGDYYSGYKNHQGRDIIFSFEKFNDLTKTYNDDTAKWAHVVRRTK